MSTATITAADINKLRQTTGAGMMDCRKALVESDGDFEKPSTICARKDKRLPHCAATARLKKALSLLPLLRQQNGLYCHPGLRNGLRGKK